MQQHDQIGLALSGGGIRAAVFHFGLLKFLAERNALEKVSAISTVSGGSLGIGLVHSLNGYQWPTSDQYLSDVLPAAKRIVTSKSLLSLALTPSLLIRHPLLTIARRANLLSRQLKKQWGIEGTIKDLGDDPVWYVNATNYESGKNWRFSKRVVGDWKFGRNPETSFALSDALAASAAVPYAIGALRLKLPREGWYKSNPSTGELVEPMMPPRETVRLWDGGVYENLGIEPLFKPGRGMIDCNRIIVSDAGAPLRPTWLKEGAGIPFTPRLFDLSTDQIRSLRARHLIEEFKKNNSGLWVQMGMSARKFALNNNAEMDVERFLTDAKVSHITSESTHLRKLSEARFDEICQLGFETTSMTTDFFWPALIIS